MSLLTSAATSIKDGQKLEHPGMKLTGCNRVGLCYKNRPLRRQSGLKRKQNNFMALHRSLRATSTLGAKRNVLKRFERVALLKKRGDWKDGNRVTGLRKTKPEA